MSEQLRLLKEYWGYDSFRSIQEDVILSVLNNTDTLALMPTGGGKSILPMTVNRAIKRIIRDHNIKENTRAEEEKSEPLLLPHFSLHHLRHTFCTRFCENETNLKVIQDIMGHSNISTTMDVYAEASQKKKVESIQNLEGKIKIC